MVSIRDTNAGNEDTNASKHPSQSTTNRPWNRSAHHLRVLELRGRVRGRGRARRGLVCDGGSSLHPICMQDLKIIRVARAIPSLGTHHGTRCNHAADQMVRAIILVQVARGRW